MIRILFYIILLPVLFFPVKTLANNLPDADRDGVPDKDELAIYMTDPNNRDTDGDGHGDWEEINSGFSPLHGNGLRMHEVDSDGDGLNDRDEILYKTNLSLRDTDGDGVGDWHEIVSGNDPLLPGQRIKKQIKINLAKQEMTYNQGGVSLGTFRISSGKPSMPTPSGKFHIQNKSIKAWSATYGLWMPYWLGIGGRVGIHELPIWPGGYREGENHLGKAVSHGCIRLGIGSAQKIFEWSEIGTEVLIEK
jgi:hypothetical protein